MARPWKTLNTTHNVEHHPYLGLELDQDLSFTQHTNQTVSKAQRNLNLLRRNLSGCSETTKGHTYNALVWPVLEYASSAWNPYQMSQINKLEAVQRKAARFVTGEHSRETSVTGLMQVLQWRTLQERRLVARLTMFYKAVNGQAASYIPQDFPLTTSRTRSSHNIQYHLPHTRLDCYKFSFFPRTIRAWNILPTQLVQAPDTENFKTQLQQHFTSGLMYMVPPRGHYQLPRLGSSGCVSGVGPIY